MMVRVIRGKKTGRAYTRLTCIVPYAVWDLVSYLAAGIPSSFDHEGQPKSSMSTSGPTIDPQTNPVNGTEMCLGRLSGNHLDQPPKAECRLGGTRRPKRCTRR